MYSLSLLGFQPSLPKPIPSSSPRGREGTGTSPHTLSTDLGRKAHAAEPHLSTAAFYLSLFTADLAQPKMTFLSSKGFYSTLRTNFLKQVERKKRRKKVLLAAPHSHRAHGREKVEKHLSQQFWFSFFKTLSMVQFSYLSWRTTDGRKLLHIHTDMRQRQIYSAVLDCRVRTGQGKSNPMINRHISNHFFYSSKS